MIAVATPAIVMAITIDMRRRSMGRFAAFHAAGARDLREAMHTSEIAKRHLVDRLVHFFVKSDR
jgi:hypothetical protein